MQYIGVSCRSDVCANIQIIVLGSETTTVNKFKYFHNVGNPLNMTIEEGLMYVRLYLDSTKVVLLTDESFSKAEGMSSQLGFVILMVEGNGKSNKIQCGSARCRRFTRSAM